MRNHKIQLSPNKMNRYVVQGIPQVTDGNRIYASKKGCDWLIDKLPTNEQYPAAKCLSELRLLRHFRHHQNIAYLRRIYRTSSDVYFFIPSEHPLRHLYGQYTLRNVLDTHVVTAEMVPPLIYQIVCGVKYIHSANVIHCDLTPENILAEYNPDKGTWSLRIYGFGRASAGEVSLQERSSHEPAVKEYRAPEIILKMRVLTNAIDMWSVGCIMAELYGQIPFLLFGDDGGAGQLEKILRRLGRQHMTILYSNLAAVYKEINKQAPRNPAPLLLNVANLPAGTTDLLMRLLEFDPQYRAGARDTLQHEYLELYHNPSLELVSASIYQDPYQYGTPHGKLIYLINDECVSFQQDKLRKQNRELYRQYREENKRYVYCNRGQYISRGGYGDVYKAVLHQRGEPPKRVAVKVMNPRAAERSGIRTRHRCGREANLWRKLRHSNIAEFIESTEIDNKPAIISSWYPNGNVKEFMLANPQLERKTGSHICRGVVEGLKYLHGNHIIGDDSQRRHMGSNAPVNPDDLVQIVHGDLKPANILLGPNWEAIICDFGLSMMLGIEPTGFSDTAVVGSVGFRAPEQRDPSPRTLPGDIWSLGCVFSEIIFKIPSHEMFTPPYPYSESLDPYQRAIRACWKGNPKGRPTIFSHVFKNLY